MIKVKTAKGSSLDRWHVNQVQETMVQDTMIQDRENERGSGWNVIDGS